MYRQDFWKKRRMVRVSHMSRHSGTRVFAVVNLPSENFRYPSIKSNQNIDSNREVQIRTVFHETPKHFNGIKFAMELGKKHTYMALALDVMLNHWLLIGEISL